MSQFSLQKTLAKIDSFTPRAEFDGGNERVPAGSIKITISGPSTILDTFFPGIRPVLFRKPDLAGEQEALFEVGGLTQVAFPKMKPLKLGEKFPGYTVDLTEDLDLSKPVTFGEATLSNLEFEMVNGGAVTLSMSIACHPNEEQAGTLCQWVQQERYITLTPPTASPQQQLPTGGEGDTLSQQDAQDAANEAASLIEKGKAAA